MAKALTLEFEELLITTVEKYPVLYDLDNLEYKNVNVTETTWVEIGEALSLSAQECAAVWNLLKVQYSTYVRELIRKPTESCGLRTYPYFRHSEIMQFMQYTTICEIQSASTNTSYESTSDDSEDEPFRSDGSDKSSDVELPLAPPIPLNGDLDNLCSTCSIAEQHAIEKYHRMPKKSLKRKLEPFEEELLKALKNHEEPCKDEFYWYGKLIAAKLRKIDAKCSKKADELQLEMLKIILEAGKVETIV